MNNASIWQMVLINTHCSLHILPSPTQVKDCGISMWAIKIGQSGLYLQYDPLGPSCAAKKLNSPWSPPAQRRTSTSSSPPSHGEIATAGPCGTDKSISSAIIMGNSSSAAAPTAPSRRSTAPSWRCLRCLLRRASRSRRSAIVRRRWSSATKGANADGQ